MEGYNRNAGRVYGERGNLMPRDIVSKCIYDAPSQVYLDIAFLGKKLINSRLFEVAEVCKKYADIDVTKDSIPVYPSVHFFMGGLAVDANHRTSIDNLYAVGECASMYHGANRLGGNALADTQVFGKRAGFAAAFACDMTAMQYNFTAVEEEKNRIEGLIKEGSINPVAMKKEIQQLMWEKVSIVRNEQNLTF